MYVDTAACNEDSLISCSIFDGPCRNDDDCDTDLFCGGIGSCSHNPTLKDKNYARCCLPGRPCSVEEKCDANDIYRRCERNTHCVLGYVCSTTSNRCVLKDCNGQCELQEPCDTNRDCFNHDSSDEYEKTTCAVHNADGSTTCPGRASRLKKESATSLL